MTQNSRLHSRAARDTRDRAGGKMGRQHPPWGITYLHYVEKEKSASEQTVGLHKAVSEGKKWTGEKQMSTT